VVVAVGEGVAGGQSSCTPGMLAGMSGYATLGSSSIT
jgi:hypothetical protein